MEREKIRIESDELFAPEVEDALARQQSFGMAAAVPRAPDRKASLLYRPWFVLMIAGALGGLAGWAIIEPFFEDGTSFDGRVEQRLASAPGEPPAFDVSGVRVVVDPRKARLVGGDAPVDVGNLQAGTHVRVKGWLVPRLQAPIVWVYELEVLPGEAPAGAVSLETLQLRDLLVALMIFPIIAALVGLFVAAADGLLSHAFRRAAVCALVGMACGLVLGLVSSVVAEIAYSWTQTLVAKIDGEGARSVLGFLAQMLSRGLVWAVTGLTMGLGQGIALRSKRMVVNGLLGGLVGGLLGGLLFDPVGELLQRGSEQFVGGELSRAVGFGVIGLATGLMIGVVELLARDAWLKMLIGPLAGKEFVLFKNPTVIGSSPKADVYLFKDPEVEPTHALLHAVGDGYEVEDRSGSGRTLLNGRPIRRAHLENGDQVRIGRTVLSFGIKES
jgi:hypothetical protein